MMPIAHRGWWHTTGEQNTPTAIRRALERGWGVEFDVWPAGVGHDAPTISWGSIVDVIGIGVGPLLWNVKAPQSETWARQYWTPTIRARSWLFDVELVDPELPRRWPEARYLARASEQEPLEAAVATSWADGVWLDTVGPASWVTAEIIQRVRDAGKVPFVVSPELHRRPILLEDWCAWAGTAICTDVPQYLEAYLVDPALQPVDPWW